MQCSNFNSNYFSGSLSHPMLEVRVTYAWKMVDIFSLWGL